LRDYDDFGTNDCKLVILWLGQTSSPKLLSVGVSSLIAEPENFALERKDIGFAQNIFQAKECISAE
jgi:hypothetical protein